MLFGNGKGLMEDVIVMLWQRMRCVCEERVYS